MEDPRLREVLHLLDPPAGKRLWYGGAGVTGCLRGVTPEQAAWRPAPKRHSIWALTLHLAYWNYAVRRIIEDLPQGGFPRSPANWPAVPKQPDARHWKADRALLRTAHEQLVGTVRALDPVRLDEAASGSGKFRVADLLFGVATHDIYHVGQIQMLKRLYGSHRGGK